ncbi:glycosyltransferase family A protein [Mesorhizobium sp.]|uniref:glycosyltransferase family A protein n=1 Tax=Mesorhizobium sp. TaxID=1871066 RepID=UPI001214698E|nr:glycosyltransferase family A protein [Mesorhizobium sp.]TIX23950.1 MAG: glycosyltransferase [Mesorhizobium sp.]
MVSKPRLSILMPTRSRVDVIGLAIQSVLDQTVEDFELLVVGDGCAPGTTEVVEAFQDARIRLFDLPKAPNYGYANRNIALREARGDLIGFAADDDLLFPDHFEILADGLKGGAAIAYSQALWVSTDGIAAPFLTNLELADEFGFFMESGNTIPASCFLYRADCLPSRDVWPEDVTSAADWRLWQRIIRDNPHNPLSYCRVPTVLHFSAKWKNSRHSQASQLATFLDIADRAGWWPSALRVWIPNPSKEQSEYSRLMRVDPAAWSEQMRRAVGDLVARLAWEDIQATRPMLASAEAEKAMLQPEISRLRNELDLARQSNAELRQAASDTSRETKETEQKLQACRVEIAALYQSRSWRITAPLRRIATSVRSPKSWSSKP